MDFSAQSTQSDILVVGTGLAGLAAALACAKSGLTVTLAGPTPGANGRPDPRTTALFGGSVHFLENIGLPRAYIDSVAPLTGLRLIDDTGRLLRAPETLFQAHETGRAAFGANFENAYLLQAMAAEIRTSAGIRWVGEAIERITPAPDEVAAFIGQSQIWTGRLVIGADGRDSICRRDAGITATVNAYPQSAVVGRFKHSKPHNGISTEFHRRAGPLTTVPLPGNSSSLVWVVDPDEAQRLIAMDASAFCAELGERLQGALGAITEIEHRSQFPLRHLSVDAMARSRTALIGEAAHIIPPIGAQGLNLGIRDIAALFDIIVETKRSGGDIGSAPALQRYAASRKSDVLTRSMAIDALNKSLLAGFLPIDILRGAGIAALGILPWLRARVMEQGIGPSGPIPSLLQPPKRDGREL